MYTNSDLKTTFQAKKMHPSVILSMHLVIVMVMVVQIAAVAQRTVGIEAMLGPATVSAQHSPKRNNPTGHNTR